MDAQRHRLYWLNDGDSGNLVVNQLEYTSTACDPNRYVLDYTNSSIRLHVRTSYSFTAL